MRHQSMQKRRATRLPQLLFVFGATALCLWGLCSLCLPILTLEKPPRQSVVGARVEPSASPPQRTAASFSSAISPSPQEKEIRKKLSELQKSFPQGAYWNHAEGEGDDPFATTHTPCEHAVFGDAYCHHYEGATQEFFPCYKPLSQCLAFASFLSDQLFGEDAPISVHRSFSRLKPGDHIRLTGEEHSMIVVEKDSDSVTVAEVNSDYEHCQISWDRTVSREELEALGEEVEYLTRYPQNDL